MNKSSTFWVRIALVNLCIVAALGNIMRYKIAFPFPFFDQKFLQEAHSHFALSGWITHCLYFLLVILFQANLENIHEKRYRILILVNLFSSYGMLVSFMMQGYGLVSIILSSITLINGYVFSYFALKDTNRLATNHPAKNWIRVAIWFGILSTLGTIVLSHMLSTHQFDLTTYLGSIYFFLHFQYNGFFLFACMGIFIDRVKHIIVDPKQIRYSFWLFFLSCIPAYFLSTLWADLPVMVFASAVLAAILQVVGWFFMVRFLRSNIDKLKLIFRSPSIILFLVVALAFTLKLILQLGSTIPEVSKLAFGFRPIVIAYLHLVLLLIISVFLLTYMYGTGLLKQNRNSKIFLMVFVIAVIFNEIVLGAQGIGSFSYTVIPYSNEILFAIAVILFSSILLLLRAQFSRTLININHP